MLNISLKAKPLSINKAWRGGARFRTNDYLSFEKELSLLLPKQKVKGEVEIHYVFYIRNYGRTDTSNLIKCLEDILVKRGIIDDDRKVVFFSPRKVRSDEEKIEIVIKPYELQP